MATYIYSCPVHGEIEIEHSMSADPEKFCPKCKEEGKDIEIKRVIAAPSSFILSGGGWSSSGYHK